jgi:hypothetical protein
MRSDYIKIKKIEDHYQHYLTYTEDEASVAVYLNGARLFLNENYTISNRTITLNLTVKPNDMIIVSYG